MAMATHFGHEHALSSRTAEDVAEQTLKTLHSGIDSTKPEEPMMISKMVKSRYAIIDRIGSGGFGSIFRGTLAFRPNSPIITENMLSSIFFTNQCHFKDHTLDRMAPSKYLPLGFFRSCSAVSSSRFRFSLLSALAISSASVCPCVFPRLCPSTLLTSFLPSSPCFFPLAYDTEKNTEVAIKVVRTQFTKTLIHSSTCPPKSSNSAFSSSSSCSHLCGFQSPCLDPPPSYCDSS